MHDTLNRHGLQLFTMDDQIADGPVMVRRAGTRSTGTSAGRAARLAQLPADTRPLPTVKARPVL